MAKNPQILFVGGCVLDVPPSSILRCCFGPFEFRMESRELRREGQVIPLPDQAGRVLAELLRASGGTVTREHLIRTLWPDKVSGDFEGGLHAAVRKLRKALGDDGAEPRFIGTLPKRGYRLMVPVTAAEEEASPEGASAASSGAGTRRKGTKYLIGASGAALLALAAALWLWHPWREARRSLELPGGVTLELVHFPPGEFHMGFDTGYKPTEPVHRVTLTHGFWMGRTEVTQAQWRAVMGNNPSYFQGDDKPVEQVSWDDCQAFLARLNQLVPDLVCRLPTEAEWEYASRSGSGQGRIEGIDGYAWHIGNSLSQTHPVATKAPNAAGLQDMVGNVWEWCADGFGPLRPDPQQDPVGAVSDLRSVRGGSCLSPGGKPALSRKTADRVTLRYGYPPDTMAKDLGFRVVAVPRSR